MPQLITWKQLSDEHHIQATIGPFRIRIQPDLATSTAHAITYQSTLDDANQSELWSAANIGTLAHAKAEVLAELMRQICMIMDQVRNEQRAMVVASEQSEC